MSETNKPKLLPCPFCGATPHRGPGPVRHDQLHGDVLQSFGIWCPKRHAKIECSSEDLAIADWNNRPASLSREAALREALEKASGYMTNAAIDLQTGAPKRTALNTIEGGLKMVRAALDQGTQS